MKHKKIIIAGGKGFIGTYFAKAFAALDYQVIILTRHPSQAAHRSVEYVYWDGVTEGDWTHVFEGAEAVINLSGRSVDCRYHEKNRQEILNSRIHSTQLIGRVIHQTQNKPNVWINASSATIYADTRGNRPANTESNGTIGDDFSMGVCKAWEHTFNEIETLGVRKLILRMAIVLGADGGALKPLRRLTQLGLGGRMGSGEQFMSWIHIEDLLQIVLHIIEDDSLQGAFNCASPNPVTNATFMRALRTQKRMPFGIPTPASLLKIGALLIRTETELILKSRKVYPERMLNAGFQFQYDDLENALSNLINPTNKRK